MRVLVVDDNRELCELLARGIRSRTDFEVTCAVDRGAVEIVRAERPDLVIVDMHLSDDLDGVTLLQEIREFDPDVRFILMTGKKRLDVATRLVEGLRRKGVVSYLFKPFSVEELAIAVTKALAPTIL